MEVKAAAVTVHWRRTPGAEGVVRERVAAEAARTGLVAHVGRASVELRPPVGIDKGTVVDGLTDGCRAACFLGDDLGDLPAYAALAHRAAVDGTAVVGVGVRDAETAPEVLDAADLVVDGPEGALAVLAWLAAQRGDVLPVQGRGRGPSGGWPAGRRRAGRRASRSGAGRQRRLSGRRPDRPAPRDRGPGPGPARWPCR